MKLSRGDFWFFVVFAIILIFALMLVLIEAERMEAKIESGGKIEISNVEYECGAI